MPPACRPWPRYRLKFGLALSPRHGRGLLLEPPAQRLDLVEHAQKPRATTKGFITHLPEVARGPLAGFRVRDSTSRVANQACQARLGEPSGLPQRSEVRAKIPVRLGDHLVHHGVTPP